MPLFTRRYWNAESTGFKHGSQGKDPLPPAADPFDKAFCPETTRQVEQEAERYKDAYHAGTLQRIANILDDDE